MNITLIDGLPCLTVVLKQAAQEVVIHNLLLDTGSGGSVFSVDLLESAGITPERDAFMRRIVGVGGEEFVVEITVDSIAVGKLSLDNFAIESGSVDYGFDFDGILGFDFLQQTGAVIDLANMEIYPHRT